MAPHIRTLGSPIRLPGSLELWEEEVRRARRNQRLRFLGNVLLLLMAIWVFSMAVYVLAGHAGDGVDTQALIFRPLHWIFG